MGYTCAGCGRWVGDSEIHNCAGNAWRNTYYYPYYLQSWKDNNHKCSKIECIYHPGEDWLSKDKCKHCQNLSIIIDESGQCISFVKKKKETEQ